MWAQLIKMQTKPGKADELISLGQQMRDSEPPDSGLQRSTIMRDQNDPATFYVMIVFDSEEKARARESDPRRRDEVTRIQAAMAECMEGPPQFVDLTVVRDDVPHPTPA
jgi:quinol monooxygenase YgiN